MDNRGVGRSSIPRRRAAYSTSHMASDVLAVLVCTRVSSRVHHDGWLGTIDQLRGGLAQG